MSDEPNEPSIAELVAAMEKLTPKRQIIICEVGQGLRTEALILRYGMDRWWSVQESPLCPEGKMIIVADPLPDVKTL